LECDWLVRNGDESQYQANFRKNENIVQLLKEQIDERREKLDRLAKLRKSLKENILKNCCQCIFILAVILLLTLVSF
jgi:hypothetical protein